MEILGTMFTSNIPCDAHIDKRVNASRRASPIKSLFTEQSYVNPEVNPLRDGVVDSLRYLICNENFIKPYSEEHVLATLLTRAF